MILRPDVDLPEDDDSEDDVLATLGLTPKPKKDLSKVSRRELFRDILDSRGASDEEIAAAIAEGLTDPKQRSQFVKIALEAKGYLDPKNASVIPQISIAIVDGRPDAPKIIDVLSPE